MHDQIPESFERETSLRARLSMVLALVGLVIILIQVSHEHRDLIDPEGSVPLLLRSTH